MMIHNHKKLSMLEEATWPRAELIRRLLEELRGITPELNSLVLEHVQGEAFNGAQLGWLTAALHSIVRVLELDARNLSAARALDIFAEHELMSYYRADEVEDGVKYWNSESLIPKRSAVTFADSTTLYALISPRQQITRDYIPVPAGQLMPNRNRMLPRMYELRGGKPSNQF